MFTFVIVVILFFYIYNVSKRMKQIESRLGMSQPVNTPVAMQQKAQADPQSQPAVRQSVAPAAVIHEPVPQSVAKPQSGMNVDIGSISGNQWFTIIGVIALLFGIGFFLKFAIEQGWISPLMRVALGTFVGLLLVVLGEIWREKYDKYARSLTGGGVAVLYFCIYASFQYYQLISQTSAFILAVVLTVLGVFLAYRYASKALAVLALVGAYLSPLMLSSGQDSQIGLFVYLSIVNLGVIGMLNKDFWIELPYISLLGTAFNFGFWFFAFSNSGNTLNSMVFLLFNFILMIFSTAIIFGKFHQKGNLSKTAGQSLAGFELLSGAGLAIATTALLYWHFHSYLWLVSLLVSVIYFMSYVLVDRQEDSLLNNALSFAGFAFVVSACFWQLFGTTLSLYLLLVAVLGVIVGIALKRKEIRVWGIVTLIGAAVQIFSTDYDINNYQFFTNAKFGLEALLIVIFFAVAYFYNKLKDSLTADEHTVTPLLAGLASGMLWFAVTWEIANNYKDIELQNTKNLALSFWWMAYAVILGIASGVAKSSVIRKISVGLFIITILKVFLYDVQTLDTGYKIASFITLGLILLGVSFAYQKNKERFQHFLSVNK